MKKKICRCIVTTILLSVAALCGFFFAREYMMAQEEISAYTEIQESCATVVTDKKGNIPEALRFETDGLPYVNADFDALLKLNPETVGWVAIPDTPISYPVMLAKDNSKYLNCSSTGEYSKTGAVFVDCNNSFGSLDKNTVIYGHNMGAGRTDMFGTLLYYGDREYYERHKYVQFDTIAERRCWWKIFAVIDLDVKAGRFDYLKLDFQNNTEFMEWIGQAKALSLYDTDVNVGPKDKVITLSTCDRRNYGRNGRQLILAINIA